MKNIWATRLLSAGAVLTLGGVMSGSALAASITADLTCVLNGPDNRSCVAGPSFGTVKIDDTPGAGDLKITVDLLNDDLKFRDLMLAFGGLANTIGVNTEVGGSNTVSLTPGGFSISGFSGAFDVGGSGGQGWNKSVKSVQYSAILDGDSALTLDDFLNAFSSTGHVSVGIHIQSIGPAGCDGASDGSTDCVPGQAGDDQGEGSLKIGGVFAQDPGDDIGDVPEPSTMLLLGGALLGLGWIRKKRNS